MEWQRFRRLELLFHKHQVLERLAVCNKVGNEASGEPLQRNTSGNQVRWLPEVI